MEENKNYFWQDGLSADESRVSAVVVAFLATTTVALWSYVRRDYIGPEMVLLLQSMIAAVTGINVAKSIMENLPSRNNLPPSNNTGDIDKKREMV